MAKFKLRIIIKKMKLSLPGKLTLGGAKPKEEEKSTKENQASESENSPKYSSAEVKLMVIAIEVSLSNKW